jgi:hypothetical protein
MLNSVVSLPKQAGNNQALRREQICWVVLTHTAK